jgi:mono/diheme cytochrome c family protein
MTRYLRHSLFLTLTLFAVTGWGFPWEKDMVDQASIKPQESAAPPDPAGMPVTGGEPVPAPPPDGLPAARKAAARLQNPVSATPESTERGAALYRVHCLVCHGATGAGNGPVGLKFEDKTPADLNDETTQDQADGEIFFTLTRGKGAMPPYRDALSREERWDVINYLRHEFGKK